MNSFSEGIVVVRQLPGINHEKSPIVGTTKSRKGNRTFR